MGEGEGAAEGPGEGAPVGVHVYTDESVSQHGVPMSLPVTTFQLAATPLEIASTSVGTSEQSLFDASTNLAVKDVNRPNCDGIEPVMSFCSMTNQLVTPEGVHGGGAEV